MTVQLLRYSNPRPVVGLDGEPEFVCPVCDGRYRDEGEARSCAERDHDRRVLARHPDAPAGLKLLSAKVRGAHPAAQLRSLVRVATRAMYEADWYEVGWGTLPGGAAAYRGTGDAFAYWGHGDVRSAASVERVAKLRRKVELALAACHYLNERHALGYPSI